jgi:hypothetical protein
MPTNHDTLRTWTIGGLALAALALGCSTTPEVTDPRETMKGEFAGAPDWVVQGCSTYWGDEARRIICGVGSAGGSQNVSLMRTTAIGRGRSDIARTLTVQIKAMLKDYAATTTGGQEFGHAAADEQYIVDVSKQITDMTLAGTEHTDSWVSENGTYYALVALDIEKFSDSVGRMDQLSESMRRAVVERAERAFGDLDQEIERERDR